MPLSMGHTIHLLALQAGVLFNKLRLMKVRGRVKIKRSLLWLSFSILDLSQNATLNISSPIKPDYGPSAKISP